MTLISGPNSTSAPVIYMDTGSPKGYNGQPTTNLMTTNPLPTSTTGFVNAGGSRSDAGATLTYDSGALLWQIDTYQAWGAYVYADTIFDGTIDSGIQYTVSFEWKSTSEHILNSNNVGIVQGNGVSPMMGSSLTAYSVPIGDGWNRYSYTFTPANTGVGAYLRLIVPSKTTGVWTRIWWKKLQFEALDHSTPFVIGTRANTDSVKQLGTSVASTIVPTSMSYDATKPYYNGTSNYTLINSVPAFTNQNDFTIETVVNVYSSTGANQNIVTPSNNGIDQFISIISTRRVYLAFATAADTGGVSYSSNTVIEYGKFYHIVMVRTPTDISLYINGKLDNSWNVSTVFAQWGSSTWNIGFRGDTNTWWLPGEIPVVRSYNRSLNSEEVFRNFSSIRGRFSI